MRLGHLATLCKIFSGMRFITLLRDPVQRYISQYQYNRERLGEHISFDEYLHTPSSFNKQTCAMLGRMTFPWLKILFVVNSLKRRGAEQQLYNFVKELPPMVDVSVFRFSTADDEFPEFLNCGRAKIYSSKYQGTYNLLRLWSLYDCLSKEKYDVVVTVGLGAALLLGRICAFLFGIKIIYSTLNTFENFNNIPRFPGDYFDILNKALNTLGPLLPGKRILRFLANSDKLAEKISLCGNRYAVETLYNGLVKEEFENLAITASDANTRRIYAQFEGCPTIVQVGELDVNKNQVFTLQCIRDIKKYISQLRFLIIGEGLNKPELIKWIVSNDLGENVILAGQMDRTQCLYLMRKADLLVLTSESESFPNVLVEGHALSLPVVSFDVGAASEIVEDGVTGYVIPKGDSEEFKKKMVKVLLGTNLAARMGKTGKERVFDLFSMDNKVTKFISMIEKDFQDITENTQSHSL